MQKKKIKYVAKNVYKYDSENIVVVEKNIKYSSENNVVQIKKTIMVQKNKKY